MIDWQMFKDEAEAARWLIDNGKAENFAGARKYIYDNVPKERYYQEKIMKHIKQLVPSAFVWKAAAGPYSRQGIPDVCAIMHGRYYGFEIKRPLIGKLSRIQEQTIKQIKAAGGRAYVVTCTKEVTEILGEEILESAGDGNIIQTEADNTKKYAGMIESFECDFSLAAEENSRHGLDELQLKIENSDDRLLCDIDLLQKLSFGIRNGKIRIMEKEAGNGKGRGI
jgi:Holliday junction resolvase